MHVIHHQIVSGVLPAVHPGCGFEGINEDSELVLVFILQEVGYLAVDEERIAVVLVLHHMDHLHVFSLGDLILLPRRCVEGQVVGEGHDRCLLGDCHVGEGQSLKRQHNAVVAHKPIDQVEVSKISAFDSEAALVDLVDELDSPLDILLDGVLRDEHCVFDLLVIEEGLLEVSVSLAPLLLHPQPHPRHPEIPLRKEPQHVLVAVNDAEYLGNPPQASQCEEHALADVAADVDDQRRVQLLDRPSGLLDELVVDLLLVEDEVDLAEGGDLEPALILGEAVELLADAHLFLMQL